MAYAGCRGSAPARRNPLSASRWIASTAAAQRVNSGHRSILWPRDSRSSTTDCGNLSSYPNRPARYSNGANESGKLYVENRGALIASCTSIPKWKTFRNTCSIACTCMSPPGQPNVNTEPSSRTAMAGFGVRRGRLPGATPDGWRGSGRDWSPRDDGTMPSPGTAGEQNAPSDGVAEKALPQRSIVQTYDVSIGRAPSIF